MVRRQVFFSSIENTDGAAQAFRRRMGINFCHRHVGVPKQTLYFNEVYTLAHQIRGKGVTQQVCPALARKVNARRFDMQAGTLPDNVGCQWFAVGAAEKKSESMESMCSYQ